MAEPPPCMPGADVSSRSQQRTMPSSESTSAPSVVKEAVKTKVVKKKKKPYPVAINLANCKYDVVREVQRKLGWIEVGDEDEWQVYWTDTSITIDRLLRLHKAQKINRFVGMLEICRKKPLARNIARMAAKFSEQFSFVPQSYTLPNDYEALMQQLSGKKKKTYILKPDAGCQGKGISLVQTPAQLRKAFEGLAGTGDVVAQRYLHKPLLIDGYKFDLRIYVLVVSCRPLRMFIYGDGLARFCTEEYHAPNADNLDDTCMHLTNYAINKRNDKFAFNSDAGNTDEGSKWTLDGLRDWMDANGHCYDTMWSKVSQLCVKTVCSIQPHLEHQYTSVIQDASDHGFRCFEMLGLDVLLDNKCEPWLVEVNHSPSLTTDTPLDFHLKHDLIKETFELVGVDSRAIKRFKKEQKESLEQRLYGSSSVKTSGTGGTASMNYEQFMKWRERFETKHLKKYERIYPVEDRSLMMLYDSFLKAAREHYSASVHSKVRATLDRISEESRAKLAAEKLKKIEQAGSPRGPRPQNRLDGGNKPPTSLKDFRRKPVSPYSSAKTTIPATTPVRRRQSLGGNGQKVLKLAHLNLHSQCMESSQHMGSMNLGGKRPLGFH